jgi:hypothetical protein
LQRNRSFAYSPFSGFFQKQKKKKIIWQSRNSFVIDNLKSNQYWLLGSGSKKLSFKIKTYQDFHRCAMKVNLGSTASKGLFLGKSLFLIF